MNSQEPSPTLAGFTAQDTAGLLSPELQDPNLPSNHTGFVCQGSALRDLQPRSDLPLLWPHTDASQPQLLFIQIPFSMQDLSGGSDPSSQELILFSLTPVFLQVLLRHPALQFLCQDPTSAAMAAEPGHLLQSPGL